MYSTIMKKIFTIIAAALMAVSVSAQSDAGSFTIQPNVGITYTTATGDYGKIADGAVALTAGVEGMYMINDKFGAAFGLNYTGNNVSKTVLKKDYIQSNYYFNIPVTANYYVASGLALKAGIAVNFLSTSKFDGEDENVLGVKYKDSYESTFFSLPVGASYEINDFVFNLRYNFGLGDVSKVYSGSYNALSFTVGYKF